MAIEDIAICFYNGTAPSVSGKTINAYNSGLTSGTLDSDLSGYDTGAATGVSLALSASLTADNNGRLEPDPPGAGSLDPEINRQGAYSDKNTQAANDFDFTLTFPSTVTSVDVEVFLCTPYVGQTSIDVDVNGSTSSGWDSTNNTTGSTITFTGIVPNGSDQVIINTFNTTSNRYVFHNGFYISNIVESGGGGATPIPPRKQKLGSQFATIIASRLGGHIE